MRLKVIFALVCGVLQVIFDFGAHKPNTRAKCEEEAEMVMMAAALLALRRGAGGVLGVAVQGHSGLANATRAIATACPTCFPRKRLVEPADTNALSDEMKQALKGTQLENIDDFRFLYRSAVPFVPTSVHVCVCPSVCLSVCVPVCLYVDVCVRVFIFVRASLSRSLALSLSLCVLKLYPSSFS